MEPSVAPTNVIAAALLTQLLLVVIMLLAAGAHKAHWAEFYAGPRPWLAALLLLITFWCLVFSKDFIQIWKPLFGGELRFMTVAVPYALTIMFTLDISVIAILVWFTGGSRSSAFTSLFFILPAIAIFLREPPTRFLWYLALVGVLFSVCMRSKEKPRAWASGETLDSAAYWIVSIASLGLTALIGYVTRPR